MKKHCLDKQNLENETQLFVKIVGEAESLSNNSLPTDTFARFVGDYIEGYCNSVCSKREECRKYFNEIHSKSVIDAGCEGADQLVRKRTREENEQILKHKWNLSEAAGMDVGFDFAREDFKKNHQKLWETAFKKRYCQEICQYELTCQKKGTLL